MPSARAPSAVALASRHLSFLLVVTALLILGAAPAFAQEAGLSQVTFTNQTGFPRDGLGIFFNQALAANQPELVPGGGNIIPPFTTAPLYFSPDSVIFTGATVPAGGRVPSTAGSSMSFTGGSVDSSLEIVQAFWLSGGTPTHTVARISFLNETGAPANRIQFQALDAVGAPLNILSVTVPDGYAPATCLPTISGVPGTSPTVDLPCCLSGFGGVIGPLQITLGSPDAVAQITYSLSESGTKAGSAARRVPVNREELDGNGGVAVGFSVATNLPIVQLSPSLPFLQGSVVGLRSRDIYACGGTVATNDGIPGGALVITSNHTGPENIRFTDFLWYRPPTLEGSAPDLIYYGFDEAGGATTANAAIPGVGHDPAPVAGHQLGVAAGQFGGALRGIGGLSLNNFVDSGWTADLGTGDFTVGVWIDRNGASPSGMAAIFGDPSCFDCTVSGNDITLRVGFPPAMASYTIPGGFSPGAPAVLAWVRDAAAGEVRTYRDGALVAIHPSPAYPVNGFLPFKVGGSGAWAALPDGTLLDEFRLYRRALGPAEIADTFAAPLPLVPLVPQWQVNTNEASLQVDGIVGDEFCPASVVRCVGENPMLYLNSINTPLAWDLVVSAGAQSMQPLAVTGLSIDGQPINVNPFNLGTVALNNLQFLIPFANTIIPLLSQVPGDLYAQFVIASPSQPSGLALSAASSLTFTSSGSQVSLLGPSGDDTFIQVVPGAQPLCGPATVSFAGTAYAAIFVNSNGSVSFGAGSTDPSPTVAAFAQGPPRLAGLWSDLSPNSGGFIRTSVSLGTVVVAFRNVPEAGTMNANTFDLVLSSDGSAGIFGYDPAAGFATDSLVGLSPGSGATDPGSMVFSSLIGLGSQAGTSSDMIYEFVAGGAPAPFYSILFPNADGTLYVVE